MPTSTPDLSGCKTQAVLEAVLPRDLATLAHAYLLPVKSEWSGLPSASGIGDSGHGELYGVMLRNDDRRGWAFVGACHGGHIDLVKVAIDQGTLALGDLNCALYNACHTGQHDVMRLLVKSGATHCINCYRSLASHLFK